MNFGPDHLQPWRFGRRGKSVRLGVLLVLVTTVGAVRAQDDTAPPEVAAVACRGLGYASWPLLWPLTWGSYDPTGWANDRDLCLTLTSQTAAAVASFGVGFAAPNQPPVFGAGSFDQFFRNALRSRTSSTNAFEGAAGVVVTPLIGTALLVGVSGGIGGVDAYRDTVTTAIPLMWIGIGGTNLLTVSAKKAFGRERPYLKFNNQAGIREFGTGDDARQSFFSGHVVTAFFSAAFTDRALTELIRQEVPGWQFGHEGTWPGILGRVAQATALYGVATYVGYTRIEDDQHFMTDVLAGAFVGTLSGQLTYHFGLDGRLKIHPYPQAPGLEVSLEF